VRTLVALLTLAGLGAGFLVLRQATATQLRRGERLRAQAQEFRVDAESTAGAATLPNRSSNAELLRLRNEVRGLRGLQQESEKLRAANQRLAAEIQSGKFRPRQLADMEGAVPREKWAFVGFATPEAAAQSFVKALASGDPEQILRCLPPHTERRLRQQMTEHPDQFRAGFMAEMAPFTKLAAFRIVSVEVDDDKAMVNVQFTAGGKPFPFELWREDNQEWRVGM